MIPIILAAGNGRRLAGEPKSLLPFGLWQLIDIQLVVLKSCGFGRAVVVTRDKTQEISERVGSDGLVVQAGEGGSAETLRAGLAATDGEDVLILHGDVLLHPEALREVLEEGPPCAVCDNVTARGKPDVVLADGRVLSFGSGTGTYLGVLALRGEHAQAALPLLDRARADWRRMPEYWDVLAPIWPDWEVQALIPSAPLVDIDTSGESLYAHRRLWPRIRSYLID